MVLEVKNSSNETIKKWKDEGKQVLDPQIAYILADILSDPDARASLHGRFPLGLYVDGVQTAGKTGTSDKDSKPKDLWIMNYSPTLTMGLWLGNSDTSTIRTSNSVLGGRVVSNVLSYAYKDIYAAEGKWKAGDWFERPEGIQQQGRELYPSWWNKNQGQTKQKLTFDRVSKFKATDCTPAAAKIEIEVLRSIDPVTKREVFIAPDGYDASKDDDKHSCDDPKPTISNISYSSSGSGTVSFTAGQGKFALQSIEVLVDGKSIGSVSGSASSAVVGSLSSGTKITIVVTDEGYYSTTSSTYTVGSN